MYRGVTLDRTLSFNRHTSNVKAKEQPGQQHQLGSKPRDLENIRVSTVLLNCRVLLSCIVSCHAKKVDPELNKACRTITGNLRQTPLQTVYRLAGIAPPNIRRDTQTRTQKHKQEIDSRHSLYEHNIPNSRLKSRNSFMTTESLNPLVIPSYSYRIEQWREWDSSTSDEAIQLPEEELPKGKYLPRNEWVRLNRARAKVATFRSGA